MIYLPSAQFENVPTYIKKLNFAEAVKFINAEQDRFLAMTANYPREMKASANLYREYLVEKFDLGLPNAYEFPTFSEEEREKQRIRTIEVQALVMIGRIEDRLNVSRQYEGGLESLIDEVTRMKLLDVGTFNKGGRKFVKYPQVVYDYVLDTLNEMYARKAA